MEIIEANIVVVGTKLKEGSDAWQDKIERYFRAASSMCVGKADRFDPSYLSTKYNL
jgi:hypothetical protein